MSTSTSSTPGKLPLHIISVGLSAAAQLNPHILAAAQAVEAQYARCNAHITLLYYTPDQLADSTAYLQQHGHQLDGVLIGFGVRGSAELTAYFEQLVQAVQVHAPKAKLMFNSNPKDSLEAIQRTFPQLKEQQQSASE